MRLSEVKVGQKVIVERIILDNKACKSLYEVGLTEGVEVTVIRFAGFNGPCELFLRGFHLAIRISDAKNIMVKVCKK